MARRFKIGGPFNVAMKLLKPTSTMVRGTRKDTLPDPETVPVFFGTFRTYGGTENTSNDVYTLYDTAQISTWYNPDITQECLIYICETGQSYKIITAPEDINSRHQYMTFKVEKVGGKP